jgi:hypothetical protein
MAGRVCALLTQIFGFGVERGTLDYMLAYIRAATRLATP